MVRLKAQFMLISAVVAGLIMITAGAVISDIESQTFEADDFQHKVHYLESEASKITEEDPTEVEKANFRELVRELDYDSEVDFWNHQGDPCVNVTLQRPGERHDLNCLPDGID